MEHERTRPIPALLGELAELARNAPGRLAERLGELSLAEQAELALLLPPRERLELLLHSPQSMRLVRSLPDSELYLTVRELGPSDALPLVALSSSSQLAHLIDLESWRADRFDADRSGAWLALFVEAGDPTIRRFLRNADDEMLALLFRSWLRPEPLGTDEEPLYPGSAVGESDDEGFVSPDGGHRLSPKISEHAAAARRLVEVFFLDQPDRYRMIVWAAEHQFPSELEEESLHWRQSRLEEHGFPPWEEALAVYAPPSGQRRDAIRPGESPGPTSLVPPGAPLRLETGTRLLREELDSLDDESRARRLQELVALANRVLIADRADTGDPATHRAALARAVGSVTIALESRARRGTPSAEPFSDVPLIELFREGHGVALELQRHARALASDGWLARHGRALELLDIPLGERIIGLLEPRPLYLEIDRSGAGALRPFRSLAEIEETRNSLELVELLGELFVARLGLDLARVFESRGPRSEPPRLSTFLLTLLAWHSERGELRSDPVPGDVVAAFLRRRRSGPTPAADPAAQALEALLAELDRTLELSPRSLAMLRGFGRASLERLSAECGALDPDQRVDSRFLSCLLLAGD